MGNLDYKLCYGNKLPHIQPPGALLFVTYRLAGTIPQAKMWELIAERQIWEQKITGLADPLQAGLRRQEMEDVLFKKWDAVLDMACDGPLWLREPTVAQIVVDSLHYLDGDFYDLDCFCVMSNHVHAIFKPLQEKDGGYVALPRIMHSLKGFTAVTANRILGREGQFWQHGSYDHFVRDESELARLRLYVLNNPVKAGLVEVAEDWPWSYARWWVADLENQPTA